MEFGIFAQATVMGPSAHDPTAEHKALMDELALIRQADKYGIKYAWISEHHGLEEYSHLSASESFIPFALAQTKRIHVGAGIWPLNPVTNHPVRLAERAAICDHLSEGRFEFGTGRGAGSYEISIFNLTQEQTRENWEEVIWEFRKIWSAGDYSHQGKAFSVPNCRIFPKPFGGPGTHPAMWLAVGSPPSFEKAGRYGLGALGFGLLFSAPSDIRKYADIYKNAIAKAEPVGNYVNDNFMVGQVVLCLEDPKDAREVFRRTDNSYLRALMHRYHDSFPRPEGFPAWPTIPPAMTEAQVEAAIAYGYPVGGPDEVIAALKAYEAAGVDQVVFNQPYGQPLDISMEIIRVIGEKVIPHFDKDPIHRTTRHRYGANAEAMAGLHHG